MMRPLLKGILGLVVALLAAGCDVIPITIPYEDGGINKNDAGWAADTSRGDLPPASIPDGGVLPPSPDGAIVADAAAVDAAQDGLGDGWFGEGGLDWGGEGPVDDALGLDGDTDGATFLDAGPLNDSVGGD